MNREQFLAESAIDLTKRYKEISKIKGMLKHAQDVMQSMGEVIEDQQAAIAELVAALKEIQKIESRDIDPIWLDRIIQRHKREEGSDGKV